jgi:hypothetical protein
MRVRTPTAESSGLCPSGARQVYDLPKAPLTLAVFDRRLRSNTWETGGGRAGKSEACHAPVGGARTPPKVESGIQAVESLIRSMELKTRFVESLPRPVESLPRRVESLSWGFEFS